MCEDNNPDWLLLSFLVKGMREWKYYLTLIKISQHVQTIQMIISEKKGKINQ